jgi:hypothetical protein
MYAKAGQLVQATEERTDPTAGSAELPSPGNSRPPECHDCT